MNFSFVFSEIDKRWLFCLLPAEFSLLGNLQLTSYTKLGKLSEIQKTREWRKIRKLLASYRNNFQRKTRKESVCWWKTFYFAQPMSEQFRLNSLNILVELKMTYTLYKNRSKTSQDFFLSNILLIIVQRSF